MRIWISSPSIDRNSYVDLREHMDIPTEWLRLEWHSPKLTIYVFYLPIFLLLRTKILGGIYYTGSVLISNLSECQRHSKWQNSRELYIFVFMGLAKKRIVFSLLSGGHSINQSIHMNIFFALRMFREMQYGPYCFVILLQ